MRLRILRAQLSSNELILLFYNCLEGVVDQGQFKNLLISYNVLEHMPFELRGNAYYLVGSTKMIANDIMVKQYMNHNMLADNSVFDQLGQKFGAFGMHPVFNPRRQSICFQNR